MPRRRGVHRHSLESRPGRGRRCVVIGRAEEGDTDRAGVEALRVRTDDGAADPAVAAFPDPPEAVDEQVVADVAPATGLHVVGVVGPDHSRYVARGVAVRLRSVVYDDRDIGPRVVRSTATHRLVRAPVVAGVDVTEGGLAGRRLSGPPGRMHAGEHTVHEVTDHDDADTV